MRFAILSDLHANLQAWRAVAADIRAAGVDQVVCLGDIVGYGPNPAEVLEEVASLADHVVLGNHDAVIGGRFDSDCFSDHARIAIEWTQSRLNQAAAEYFQQVPALLRGEGFAVSHAEFQIPERFDYIFEPHEALPSFRATEDNVMFFGHTHVPGVFRLDRETGEADLIKPGQLICNPAYRYLINVGSVGDPRDGDTRASYVIFDAAQQKVDFRKVAFDIPAYQSALRRSRLPTQPMFFQFLDPNITPAVSATRTRVFRAGEAQVQRAAQAGGARTMVLDPTRRTAGLRAAGSGAFAQRGRTPARKRQIAFTLGVCGLIFSGLAAWLIRGSSSRQAGPGSGVVSDVPAALPSQLGKDLSLLLAGEPGPLGSLGQGAALSAGVRPAPGVMGQGLQVLTPGDAVSWTPLAAAAGTTHAWWMSTPSDGDGLLWAMGDGVQLSRRGDALALRQGEKISVWGPLPREAVTPMPWSPLALSGQSFSLAARVRSQTDGVLYAETPTNGTAALTLALRADRIELASGTNRWTSAPVAPRPNEWRAIAVTYDHARGRVHFFQDGQPAGEAPADLEALPGGVARLGSGQPGTPSVSGELDDLWIFRRALSAAEARGLADHTLEPGLVDSPALLHHADFDQSGPQGFSSSAGRGFNLLAPGSITAPGAPGRGRALRLTAADDIRFSPGYAESGDETLLFGLPRPAGWHHLAFVVRPGEGGAASTVSLWWDGAEVPLREGARDWTVPSVGAVRWPGPVQLDEIAVWSRALRPAEVRELAARTYATRADHALGARLVPAWLSQDEALLTSLAMEGGTKPENLARIQADLSALEQRVRGTSLHPRVLERLADCQRRVAAEIERIAQQIQAQSSPTSAKGEHEKAALLWENYAGPFAAELSQRRKDRAAHYRRKITVAAEKSRQENDAFYQTAWPAAAVALQAADWPALEALAAKAGALATGADPAGPVAADAALLRRLADTPRRAGEALDKLQGQNVMLAFEGQKEASFHVLGLEAGGLQIARIEPDGRNRRLVVPLAKLSLRTLAARLPADDSVDLAAIRACVFAQLGRLDKAVAELQGRPHPLSDQLRDRIIAAPAATP